MTADATLPDSLPEPHIADEQIQLVDARNRPCGSARRAAMRRFRFWHRATYVVVRNRRDEICVQRRTLTKEVFPGGLDLAAGGVVGAGEAVHVAARRELAEELGIRGVPLRQVGEFVHDAGGNHIFGSLFLVDHDGPLTLQAEEVAEAFWLPPAEALALDGVTPDTRQALQVLLAGGALETGR
ncbi:8-oxo-dGTP pyrophosphatase MutT (NUDIX family) [Halomonas fontilapidosi]|uniref:8-oxo-dGTP pyrophosphatase MutT (NUDIX family) n=1 Tax=Halomonas fontilapidosi TaxID=616675 RepID=A0A7W5DME0_9GAMM|nr:NUDIX domain-containing protein [Halomonas fontilapidosi]MBB3185575.1 8-oxo-dGTP pyrophosphatase MutT (NUDIX family) [Halomonas fontilapidosi]